MLCDLSFLGLEICGCSVNEILEEAEHTCSNSWISGGHRCKLSNTCVRTGRIRPWNRTTAQLAQWFAVEGFAAHSANRCQQVFCPSPFKAYTTSRRFPARAQLKLLQHSDCKRISSSRRPDKQVKKATRPPFDSAKRVIFID